MAPIVNGDEVINDLLFNLGTKEKKSICRMENKTILISLHAKTIKSMKSNINLDFLQRERSRWLRTARSSVRWALPRCSGSWPFSTTVPGRPASKVSCQTRDPPSPSVTPKANTDNPRHKHTDTGAIVRYTLTVFVSTGTSSCRCEPLIGFKLF